MSDIQLTIRNVIALTLADFDVKLLRQEDELEVKEGLFSPTEILVQLAISQDNILNALQKFGYDIDKPLN